MSRREPPPTVRGFNRYEVSSAFQKAIRRSDVDGALYWAAELDRSGLGEYAWKRLKTMVSEEVGAVEPWLPAQIETLYQWHRGDALPLAHAVVLVARARKSRTTHDAMIVHWTSDEVREVPDYALDKHTLAGKRRGRGWRHFFEEASLLVDPATGELGPEPCEPNPYRDAARQAFEDGKV